MRKPDVEKTVKVRNLKRWLDDNYSNNGNPMFAFMHNLNYLTDYQLECILSGVGKPKETTLERYTMIVREVKEHEGYTEWTRMCNDPNVVAKLGRMPTKILGKYRYMFKNIDTQNEISLIEIFEPFYSWEI